jgi:superfamily I DNA/RNA helicase
LVLAGADSGKTHTLIHRVAELVKQGVAPEQILLITFTRKAADEMIHRTQALLNQSPLKIQGGTFHAMGLTLLKIYGAAIGLHNKFSIMDEDDATGLVHILASKRGVTSRTGFPKKQQRVAVCSRAANMLRPIPDVVATYFPWLEEHTPQLVALYRVYTDTKWQQHRMDELKKLADLAGYNPSLEVFLQDISLDPNQSKDGNRDQKDDHLTLSTIHSAKGLEWKVVFVIWLLDGQFPPVRSWYDEPVLEEVRRLFYVAVTRAKDQLTMLYPVEHYHHGVQQILTHPCRFIRSIPQPALTALHAAEVR